MIVCITGLPGSGKTTFANILIKRLGSNYPGVKIVHLTSDYIRTELFKKQAIVDQIFYSRDFSSDELERSYNGLYLLIKEILTNNPDTIVVTDGTYRESKQRIMLEIIARKCGVDFKLIQIKVPDTLRVIRGETRLKSGGHSYSFGGIYELPADALIVENTGDINELEQKAQKILIREFCLQ